MLMKKMFKSFLMAALVLTAGAFVACEDPNSGDGDKVFEGMPEISAVADVDGLTLEGGVVTVTVTSNAPWTAEVDAADVTLSKKSGNGDATVTVTVPAATAARDIKVSFTAKGKMAGVELTATAEVALFQNAAGKLTISGITPEVVGEGADFSLAEVLVVATGSQAYMIADESGAMMVYHSGHGRTVGEKINISGQVTVYKDEAKGSFGTPQFAKESTVEVVSTGNAVTYNPAVLDGTAFDAMLNKTVAEEVEFVGKWVVSDKHINIEGIEGATKTGSIKYVNNADYAQFDGQTVVIKGYFVGVSSNKYVNVLPYSVELDPNAPSLNVDKTAITFAATDGSSARATFTITTNDLEGYTLSWVIDNEADFNLGRQIPGGNSRATLYVTPKAANTGAAKTATVTITYSNGTKTLTKSVNVLHEGTTANVYNLVTEAPADWSGEYIVGSIAAPSLWYMEKRSSTSYATTHCLRAELTAPVFNGSNKVETTEVLPTILVEKVAGTEFYSIKFNNEYLGWKAGDKNYFAFSTTAPTAADTGFLWSFSIVDGLVKIDLQLLDGTKTRSLQYNANSGQERFSVYTGTQNNVSLFALAK